MDNRYHYITPYEFHEYPKWVKLADGSEVVVNDADEEKLVTAEVQTVVKRGPGRPPKTE